VSGNHDIGDNPWPGTPEGSAVNADRHLRWLDIVGADHWSLTVSSWTLLAINAQLLWSGLAAEAAQYRRELVPAAFAWPWALRGRQPPGPASARPAAVRVLSP
jgi:hypothetical protein